MRKLKLAPERDFTAAIGAGSTSVLMDSPAAGYRAVQERQAWTVDLTWRCCSTTEYNYLRAFHRTGAGRSALPFLIDLILDAGDVAEYVAQFIPGTFKLRTVEGNMYVVGAQIEAVAKTPNDYRGSADTALIALLPAS